MVNMNCLLNIIILEAWILCHLHYRMIENVHKHSCSLLAEYQTMHAYPCIWNRSVSFMIKWRPPAKEDFVSGTWTKYQITFPTSVNHQFIGRKELICHFNCPLALEKIITCKIWKKKKLQRWESHILTASKLSSQDMPSSRSLADTMWWLCHDKKIAIYQSPPLPAVFSRTAAEKREKNLLMWCTLILSFLCKLSCAFFWAILVPC